MSIERYGFDESMLQGDNSAMPARITAVHREHFEFISSAGAGLAHLKAGNYHAGNEVLPTTGDFVLLDWQEHGESRIIKTLPHKTFFSRRDPSSSGYGEQAVAANFDYVFIMQSLDRDFNIRRLERYLTLAWQSGAIPVVILTKADLCEDYHVELEATESLAIGVDVFAISTKTGMGLDQLGEFIVPGKTIVFLGSSGVGKSSLVNALAGEEIMATKDVRGSDGRGRHATTHRQLIMLPNGVMVIDTPGMRELGMWDVTDGLEQSFADVEKYFGQCKFGDCAHRDEPGCAIKEAIGNGELSLERWESYLQLCAEARFVDDKAGFMCDKAQWSKGVALKRKSLKEGEPR